MDLPFKHNGSQLDYDEESGTYLYSEYGSKHLDPGNDNKMCIRDSPAYGVTTTFVNIFNYDEVEAAIQDNTKALYIETLDVYKRQPSAVSIRVIWF